MEHVEGVTTHRKLKDFQLQRSRRPDPGVKNAEGRAYGVARSCWFFQHIGLRRVLIRPFGAT